MPPGELKQQRQRHPPAEGRGQVHAQPADGLLALRRQHRLGFLQFGQHAHAGAVVGAARVGQRQAARAAFEQASAQAGFQPSHAFAHGRGGEVEPVGGGREATSVGGGDEGFDTFEAFGWDHGRKIRESDS
ncbi:hypothetical protein D9M68_913060 [compost metagenome]